MRATSLAAVSAIAGLLRVVDAHACAVCATGDPTLRSALAESGYAGQLRVDVDALIGRTSEGANDGRWLSIDDRRIAATLVYAPSRDVSFALVLPMLWRELRDRGTTSSTVVLGDVEARAQQVVWRSTSPTRDRLALIGGLKVPTAPIGDDASGAPLPSELQPGCSGLEPFVGVAYSAGRGRWSGEAGALVYLPFAMRDGPHTGDSLRFGGSMQLQLRDRVAARFGVHARVDGSGELSSGIVDLNSGGFVAYVAPEISARPMTDVVASIGLAIPVAQIWLGAHRESSTLSLRVAIDL
jgi:hypothetical protein